MHYDADVFVNQFPIVKRFVYHLIYFRALNSAYHANQLQCEFWTHTIDAHLLQALINWCMVFGSGGCDPTHWQNLSKTRSQELQQSFRDGLSAHTNTPWRKWKNYRKELTDFRNKYAAHRELDHKEPVPNFDIALDTAYYYHQWVRKIIAPDVFDEPSLKESAAKLEPIAVRTANELVLYTIKQMA